MGVIVNTTYQPEVRGVQDWSQVQLWYPDQQGNVGPDSSSVDRTYLVPWAIREQFCKELVGWTTVIYEEPQVGLDNTELTWLNKLFYPQISYPTNVGGMFSAIRLATESNRGGNRTVPRVRRYLPERAENWLNDKLEGYMYCQGARWEPLGGPGELDEGFVARLSSGGAVVSTQFGKQTYRKYEWAKVDASFQTPPFDVATREEIEDYYGQTNFHEKFRYVRRKASSTTKFNVEENAFWAFEIPGVDPKKWPPVGTKAGFPEAEGKLHLDWYDVPPEVCNEFVWDFLGGTTNIYPFFGCPPETLVFTAWDTELKKNSQGQWLYKVGFDFVRAPKGVNYKKQPGTRTYRRLTTREDQTVEPIGKSNLNWLFGSQELFIRYFLPKVPQALALGAYER